uniref:Uncharacterized protein n=1 Tax=Oryza brachyantha TaxID=4533 RepID=J3M6R0_ORYBR
MTTSSEKDLRPGTTLLARSAHTGAPKRTTSTSMVALPKAKLFTLMTCPAISMNCFLLRFTPGLPFLFTFCATSKLN